MVPSQRGWGRDLSGVSRGQRSHPVRLPKQLCSFLTGIVGQRSADRTKRSRHLPTRRSTNLLVFTPRLATVAPNLHLEASGFPFGHYRLLGRGVGLNEASAQGFGNGRSRRRFLVFSSWRRAGSIRSQSRRRYPALTWGASTFLQESRTPRAARLSGDSLLSPLLFAFSRLGADVQGGPRGTHEGGPWGGRGGAPAPWCVHTCAWEPLIMCAEAPGRGGGSAEAR